METIVVTGGAGFIGSHVVRHFLQKYPDRYRVVNFDKLTYSGNLDNLHDVESNPAYIFRRGDIVDRDSVFKLFEEFDPVGVLHLAAESHVDRSIDAPLDFVQTNIIGTLNLLDAARCSWPPKNGRVFCHVSTDEVYGSLGKEGAFVESTPYSPRSPYSASKASADHLVRAYFHTYGLPVKITNCSNNYGSHQFPEKLIPVVISRILAEQPIPVYGDGSNVRDWLHVEDHAEAIDLVFHQGKVGESYNVGGDSEVRNIDLVRELCRLLDERLARPRGKSQQLITYVKDRPGHDFRYAIDFSKLNNELGWSPRVGFNEGLARTVDWYLDNQEWLERIKSGAYRDQQTGATR